MPIVIRAKALNCKEWRSPFFPAAQIAISTRSTEFKSSSMRRRRQSVPWVGAPGQTSRTNSSTTRKPTWISAAWPMYLNKRMRPHLTVLRLQKDSGIIGNSVRPYDVDHGVKVRHNKDKDFTVTVNNLWPIPVRNWLAYYLENNFLILQCKQNYLLHKCFLLVV